MLKVTPRASVRDGRVLGADATKGDKKSNNTKKKRRADPSALDSDESPARKP